jgi:hypothetical protein
VIYLVDTNVLLRLVDRSSPKHSIARGAARTLHADGHALHAAPQNFAEHWNVATRPIAQNGLGLSTADADRSLRIVERIFLFCQICLLPIQSGADSSLHIPFMACKLTT